MSSRRRRRRRGTAVIAALLVLAVGYGAADAAHIAPGPLTTAPAGPEPQPFPQPAASPAQPLRPPLDPATPLPAAEELTALAEDLAADVRTGGDVGVGVRDALTAEVLVDVGGAQLR